MGLKVSDLTSEEMATLATEILKEPELSVAIAVETTRILLRLEDDSWEDALIVSNAVTEMLYSCLHKTKTSCACKGRADLQKRYFEWIKSMRGH